MDYRTPDSFVRGISQARILEWVAISFSRGSSWPRDRTHVFCIGRRFFTTEPPGTQLKPEWSGYITADLHSASLGSFFFPHPFSNNSQSHNVRLREEACVLGEEGQEAQSSVVEADWDEEGSHGTKWAWHKLPGLAKHLCRRRASTMLEPEKGAKASMQKPSHNRVRRSA